MTRKLSLKAKHVCEVCGYVFDSEKGDQTSGIAPGAAFEDLPDD
ncbi:MAG TPA: rubredoxin [Methanotrichaceae archaeon]|nr:rubredoxin [Methanotrichaceae archaeon]